MTTTAPSPQRYLHVHHARNCSGHEDGTGGSRVLLQNSAYTEPEHCLDLLSVDIPNRLLALALAHLEPANTDYASVPYHMAFNWATVMHILRIYCQQNNYIWPRTTFYVVDFRSQLKTGSIDKLRLFQLDKESHREATRSGWLLKYWFGTPDAHQRNLATCIWRDKHDAVAGGRGPYHKLARGCINKMYDKIDVHGLLLVIERHANEWSFEPS